MALPVLFMGSPDFAVPSLKALLEHPELVEVRAVVTQPDKPGGRGRRLTRCAVAQLAQEHGLPIQQPQKLTRPEAVEAMRGVAAELFVVVAYGKILRKALATDPGHRPPDSRAFMLELGGYLKTGTGALRVDQDATIEVDLESHDIAEAETELAVRLPGAVDEDAPTSVTPSAGGATGETTVSGPAALFLGETDSTMVASPKKAERLGGGPRGPGDSTRLLDSPEEPGGGEEDDETTKWSG